MLSVVNIIVNAGLVVIFGIKISKKNALNGHLKNYLIDEINSVKNEYRFFYKLFLGDYDTKKIFCCLL